MSNILKKIRDNPKKSILGFLGLYLISRYGHDKYMEKVKMRDYTHNLSTFSKPPVPPHVVMQDCIVFLNYRSLNGRILDKFTSYFAPLLYSAGVNVRMEYFSNEKEFSDNLEKLDFNKISHIFVAGDDFDLSHTITSLVKLKNFLYEFPPFGIFPIGIWNSLTRVNQKVGYPEISYKFVEPLVHQTPSQRHLMRINFISEDKSYLDSKLFLKGFEWSLWRDLEYKKNLNLLSIDRLNNVPWYKFWYRSIGTWYRQTWGWFSVVESNNGKTLNGQDKSDQYQWKSGRIVFQKYCPGCKRCLNENSEVIPTRKLKAEEKSTFSKMFIQSNGQAKKKPISQPSIESSLDNPECGIDHEIILDNLSLISVNIEKDHLQLIMQERQKDYMTFIKDGFEKNLSLPYENCSDGIECSSVRIYPNTKRAKELFWIDNKEFEAKPVSISVLKEPIQIFCPE